MVLGGDEENGAATPHAGHGVCPRVSNVRDRVGVSVTIRATISITLVLKDTVRLS